MISPPLSLLVIATFGSLLGAIGSLWCRSRSIWAGLLALAITLGYAAGVLTGFALLAIALFAAACAHLGKITARKSSPIRLRASTTLLLTFLAVFFVFHLIRGFHNPVLTERIILSPRSAPYTLLLEFDKTTAGLLVLALVCRPALNRKVPVMARLRLTGPLILVTVFVVLLLAWAFHFVAWEPKASRFFFAWAVVNLGFVCLSEEALFRGLIQTQLAKYFHGQRHGREAAIGISALLFGLSYFNQGLAGVVLTTVAGLGYGLIFQKSARLEFSIAAHFLLNLTHFLLFTYPSLAPRL